jgi:hypothetical protein
MLTALTLPRLATIDSIPASNYFVSAQAHTETRSTNTKWARITQGGVGSNWILGYDLADAVPTQKIVTKALALMVGGFHFNTTGQISFGLNDDDPPADSQTYSGYELVFSITNSEIIITERDGVGGSSPVQTSTIWEMNDSFELHSNVACAIWLDGDAGVQRVFYNMQGGDHWNKLITDGADPTHTQFSQLHIRASNAANRIVSWFAPMLVFGEDQ